ncbi:hypothetical protein AM571_PC01963 (plasmid) [Rhizobium etli 8C-3]|uniref:Uncharacterized protein n=1 Tax=Rhizobium etli 8C-3 TaxID=538025 RepID=A0A1L5PHR4_RHIET|nr:hypothetical protein AM571_PC01963 [Rhizobium etli 8C-3]
MRTAAPHCLAVITRVGNEDIGRFIREQLVREGVSMRGVTPPDPEGLTAWSSLERWGKPFDLEELIRKSLPREEVRQAFREI